MKGRLAVGVLTVALFAALTAGAIALAVQNASLHSQVNGLHAQVSTLHGQVSTLTATRTARHDALCHYLQDVATGKGIPPALARLAADTVRPEGCTP